MGGLRLGREGVAQPTHSSPCRASGARSAGWAQRGRWAGSTPRYTHPVYPPGIPTWYHTPVPHVTAARVHHGHGTPGTCTYDRFGQYVGEPRGVEHSPYLGSRTGYIQLFSFIWPWVGPFSLCFTEFSPCFTEFYQN